MWHYLIRQTKYMSQVYAALKDKYGWKGYWCKQNITLRDKIQILKLQI